MAGNKRKEKRKLSQEEGEAEEDEVNLLPEPGRADAAVEPAPAEAGPSGSTGQRGAAGHAAVPAEDVEACARMISEQLSPRFIPETLHGVDEQRQKLYEMLEHSVMRGHNHSALLIGPRGCGKSLVLRHVMRELRRLAERREGEERREGGERGFGEVYLNGLVQTDDKEAVKSISQQLCIELKKEIKATASHAELLRFVCGTIKEGARPTVFVLDEFDLFAQRKKQTLLYNLLDLMQSSRAHLALVGLTTRLDAAELMEKRVRSRFSHRQVLFLGPPSVDAFASAAASLLTPPGPPPPTASPSRAGAPPGKRARLDAGAGAGGAGREAYLAEFGRRERFEASRHLGDLLPLLVRPAPPAPSRPLAEARQRSLVLSLGPRRPYIDPAAWAACVRAHRAPPARFTVLVSGLSTLEAIALIAMRRLEVKQRDSYNFHMLWDEYSRFLGSTRTTDAYSRELLLKAFERLVALEVARMADGRPATGPMAEYRPARLLVTAEEARRAIAEGLPDLPTTVRHWAEHDELSDYSLPKML
eukprot:tig00021617_g22944.t1